MSLPTAMTVTATETVSVYNGIALRVLVLTNAALLQGAAASPAAGTGSKSGNPDNLQSCPVVTTVTGSRVYGCTQDNRYNSGANNGGTGGFSAKTADTTWIDNTWDSANIWTYATFRSAAATGTPGSKSYGSTDVGSTSYGATAALEILPNGTITEDASAPAIVIAVTDTTVTTASFAPAAGSLLVALVITEGSGNSALQTGGSVTSTGAIAWTQQAFANGGVSPAGGQGYSAVWTARVPVLTSADTATVIDTGTKTVLGATDSDTASGTDTGSNTLATFGAAAGTGRADSYLASDTESARPVGPFDGVEAGTGADSGTRIKPVSAANLADAATGADSNGVVVVAGSTVFINQTGTLGDASRFPVFTPPPVQRNVSDGDVMVFGTETEALFIPPTLVFATGASGEQGKFLDGHALPAGTNPSDADTGHGTEFEKSAFPKSADAGSGTERELSAHKASSDSGSAIEGASAVAGGGPARTAKNRPLWLHYDSSSISQATITLEAPRRGMVAFNAWEYTYLPAFRAAKGANSQQKLLTYKCMSSTRDFDPQQPTGLCSGGLGHNYQWVQANHPEWIVKRSGVALPSWTGYTGHFQMDVGNAAYQNLWASNVISELTANGWDGVFMDNCLYAVSQYGLTPNDSWANDAAFQTAYKSFISNAVVQVLNAGFLVVANIAGIRVQPAVLPAYYAAGLTEAFDEFWLCFGSGSELPDYSQGWHIQVAEMTDAAGPGVQCCQGHSTGLTQEFRYCFASWLCAYSSTHDVFFGEPSDASGNYSGPSPWRPEYDWDCGQPVAAYTQPQSLIFRRDFTGGQFGGTPSVPGVIALVNGNTSGTVTVALPGTYTDQSGNHITSAVLGFGQGMTLRLGSL